MPLDLRTQGTLALGALRAAGAGTPAAGRGAGAAGAAAEAIGRAAAGGDSDRSRAVPVPRRRPSQVHARLRILDGIRVARTRVLRVMRAHGLLSPHRGRQGAAKTHDGRVITQAPNVMWGTDGVRVFTLDDGWGWIFAAVEHWNAECVGWHVCKVGSRFAALDPICARARTSLWLAGRRPSPVGWRFGWITGVSTCQTTSSSRSGIGGSTPASALSRNRKPNGVAERWNRTLKEQAIHGRIQNLEAVRAAVADFVERYNQTWRLEKLGYQTPIEAREEYELCQAA